MDEITYQSWEPMPAKLVSLHHRTAGEVNLHCLPHSGGAASMFNTWNRLALGEVAICPVEFPGHGTRLREPLLRDMESLVDSLVASIGPMIWQPFAFFGHSMGGLVCFELVRRLRKQYQREPVHLFISANSAPHLPNLEEPLSALPEDTLVQKVKELNGSAAELLDNPELREVFLPVLRADFALCETYQYHPDEPLHCPVTVLGGLNDKTVSREDLEAWRVYTTGPFRVRMFPGDHFYIHRCQDVLLEVLARELNGHGCLPNQQFA